MPEIRIIFLNDKHRIRGYNAYPGKTYQIPANATHYRIGVSVEQPKEVAQDQGESSLAKADEGAEQAE